MIVFRVLLAILLVLPVAYLCYYLSERCIKYVLSTGKQQKQSERRRTRK